MKKNDYYTEFNSTDSTVSFVSKGRHFVERHFGIALLKTKYFFKNVSNKFKEKFVEYEEEPVVTDNKQKGREANVSFDSIAYRDASKENAALFSDCVDMAHSVDNAMKNNTKNVDFTDGAKKLRELVIELGKSKSDSSKLTEILEELKHLKSVIFKKIIDSKKPKLITSDHKVKNDGPFNLGNFEPVVVEQFDTETKEVDQPKVVEETKEVDQPKVVEEIKTPTITVKPVVKNTVEVDKIDSKLDLYDTKISALETKVALNKKSLADAVKYVSKIDKILNEDNLDSREIKMYKELRSERIAMQDEAKAKYDASKKELENAKIEKALFKQSIIEIPVPQKSGKVFRKEITVAKYLEQREADMKLAKVQEEVAKRKQLEKEIASLKAQLAEKEAALNGIDDSLSGVSEKVHTEYTPEEYHEMIVNFHRPSFY